MELKILCKHLVANELNGKITVGENSANVVGITLPRTYEQHDLSQFSFRITAAGNYKNTALQILKMDKYDENSVHLLWTVTSDFTAIPGDFTLILTGVKADNSTVIKFKSCPITVNSDKSWEFMPSPELSEQILNQAQLEVEKAKAAAERAEKASQTPAPAEIYPATSKRLGGVMSGNDISVSNNGIVTVKSVIGKTIGASVPADAKFTDTVYSLPKATAEVLGGIKTDNNTVATDDNGVLSAQKAIDSIEIGGTNHVLRSKGPITLTVSSDNRYGNQVYELADIEDNAYYTISANIQVLAGNISRIQIAFYDPVSNNTIYPKGAMCYLINNKICGLIGPLDKAHYQMRIYAGIGGETAGNSISISNLKLERGNKVTDWSPAPDDFNNNLMQKSNLAVQIAHPNNYLIYDNLCKHSVMVAIPKFYLDEVIDGAPHTVHPAFIINGVEQNVIYVSKYQNIVENNCAYSLPMKDPVVKVNFDQAWNYCKNKGAGWHLITNAEWAAIALWCRKNGTMPKGNTNYGKDISEINLPQKATPASYGNDGKINRILTGSGCESWYHNGTYAGIADLNGNVWDWIGDMRLVYGELQVIPNAAINGYNTSASSADWKAINTNAASLDDLFITPNGNGTTAGSVKLDCVSGHWHWNTTITNKTNDDRSAKFAATTSTGISSIAKFYLQAMALLPEDGAAADSYGGNWFLANNGAEERFAIRGGDWSNGTRSGVFLLNFSNPRLSSDIGIGYRSAYINTTAQTIANTLELSESVPAD